MTLKDMITHLRIKKRMQVLDEQGYELFTCDTDSAVLFDYWDREVKEWLPHNGITRDFIVTIKDEETQ